MRRAGPVNRAGSVCQDLGTSVKHAKNQLRDYMENLSPASWDPGIVMHCDRDPCNRESRHRDPCNRDCRASPASRANTFLSLNFASEQNGSPEDRYFSFYITHKGFSDHKAT